MGFLADLGLDTIESDPNAIPDNKYPAFVYDAKVVKYKDTSKGQALVLTYKIADGAHKGKTVDEWKSCNPFDDARQKGFLKQRLVGIGIPESKINDLDPDDLKGLPVTITTKKNGEYTNVRFAVKRDEDDLGGENVPASSSPAGSSSSIADLL